MLRQFPEEGPAIDEYLRLIKAVSKKDFVFDLKVLAPWLAALLYRLLTLWPDRDGLEVMLKRSAKDVVSELTQNVELQAVLKPLFFHPCISFLNYFLLFSELFRCCKFYSKFTF